MRLPSIFLSHGSPMLPFTDAPARTFLTGLGRALPRPAAILVASAHWETETPVVSAAPVNGTIHDFRGFPRQLYELHYDAPGAPETAADVAALLNAAGMTCAIDTDRGLDHGAWVPLLLMYPQADIPVLQLSIQPHLGPAHHLRMGRALAALRDLNVLVIGSGSFTHDLTSFRGQGANDPAPDWVNGFADWFDVTLRCNAIENLLDYRQLAPHAVRNHPTDEHLLPLYVALGAAGAEPEATRLHASATHSVLRMDVYAFSDIDAAAATQWSWRQHMAESYLVPYARSPASPRPGSI
jgi:4,5-DOPA dioxygenase extradiol